MIDTKRLKGEIVRNGLSQRKVASMLGMSEKTFYLKMKKGDFRSTEMEQLITILNLDKPADIFFAKNVS